MQSKRITKGRFRLSYTKPHVWYFALQTEQYAAIAPTGLKMHGFACQRLAVSFKVSRQNAQ